MVKRHQIRTEAALSPAQLPNVSKVKTSLLSRFLPRIQKSRIRLWSNVAIQLVCTLPKFSSSGNNNNKYHVSTEKNKIKWVKREERHVSNVPPIQYTVRTQRENIVLFTQRENIALFCFLYCIILVSQSTFGPEFLVFNSPSGARETLINSINMQLKPEMSLRKTNEWVGTVTCVVAHFLMP